MSGLMLLLDCNRGVYLPQAFAEIFIMDKMKNLSSDDLETIMNGPDTEGYWDAWDSILGSVSFEEKGHTWHLYQDGDLWAYCVDLMTDEEYENFFLTERTTA